MSGENLIDIPKVTQIIILKQGDSDLHFMPSKDITVEELTQIMCVFFALLQNGQDEKFDSNAGYARHFSKPIKENSE